MHSNACFALVLLCLAAVQAVPAGKIEKKSVSDEPILGTSDLKLEEAGDSKDRAKKSTFCVEIRPEGQDGQAQDGASSVQTLNLLPQAQGSASSVQTLNLVPQAPLASQVQTYNLQPALQPVQTLSVMPAPQLAQQSIYVPQQMAPSVQTLQIIHSPQQPCPEAKQNIIKQNTELVPAPKTITHPHRVEKSEKLKPHHYVLPQPESTETVVNVERQPQVETMNIMHMAAPCNEQIVVVPSKPVMMLAKPQRLATLVQMPSCPHHSHQADVTQCTCKNQGYAAARSAGTRTDPMHFARARPIGDGHVHLTGKHQHLH